MEQRLLRNDARPACIDLPSRSSLRLRDRIVDYEIAERAVLLRTGELSAEQLTIACLARLYEFEDLLKHRGGHDNHDAWLPIDAQQALTQARLADQWLGNADDPRGPAPALCGITLGVRTAQATVVRNDHAQVLKETPLVLRLREQGAIVLGPFPAASGPDLHDAFDAMPSIARVCGAVLVEAADDGFSMPAIDNGASGIKPSLGFAMGWDVPGSLARCVRDASLLLAALDGAGTLGTHSSSLQWPTTARPGRHPLAGIGIGVPLSPIEACGHAHGRAFEKLRCQLGRLGARVLEFPDPLMQAGGGWETALRDNALDFMLLMPANAFEVPGWPMVSFPVGRAWRSAPINAALCGPHLSDARLIQAVLDLQSHYPQHHDHLPSALLAGPHTRARPGVRDAPITGPGKAWPTG